MSRIPEFRAWLKKEKRMVDVEEINFEHQFIQYKQYEDEEIGYDDKYVDFKDIELMQCIGLEDKNKKKIYDGDIVKTYGFKAIEVVWDEESCSFKMKVKYRDTDFKNLLCLTINKAPLLEVIGNIYENPELLEVF